MSLPKNELSRVLEDIALAQHIGHEFQIAHRGLPARLCACGRRMDPELDGYSRTCAECLGDDDRHEQADGAEYIDPQTGFIDENGL